MTIESPRIGFGYMGNRIRQRLLDPEGLGALPPLSGNILEWWDSRDTDLSLTGDLVDAWTGRVNSLVLDASGATRPTKIAVNGFNYINFAEDHMNIPAGFSWDRQDSTLFLVMRRSVTELANTDSVWHMGDSSTTDATYFVGQELSLFNASSRLTGIDHGDNIATVHRSAGSGNVEMGICIEEATVTASAAGTISDGFLGDWNGAPGVFPLTGDIISILAYNRQLDGAEIDFVQDFLTAYYKSQSRLYDKYIVYEGDSLTRGTAASDFRYFSYPAQIARLRVSEPKYNIVGISSQIQNTTSARTDLQLANNSARATRTALFWMGTNDINNGRTEVQLEGDIDGWIADVRTGDAGVNIIGCTILDRVSFDAGEEAVRVAVNDHILNTADFDHAIDLAGDARLSDSSDTTYFSVDGIHLNDTGYGVVAELVEAVLNANGLI